jgi:hypothetical protein
MDNIPHPPHPFSLRLNSVEYLISTDDVVLPDLDIEVLPGNGSVGSARSVVATATFGVERYHRKFPLHV